MSDDGLDWTIDEEGDHGGHNGVGDDGEDNYGGGGAGRDDDGDATGGNEADAIDLYADLTGVSEVSETQVRGCFCVFFSLLCFVLLLLSANLSPCTPHAPHSR